MLPAPTILPRLRAPIAPLCLLAIRTTAGHVHLTAPERHGQHDRLERHIVQRHGPLDLSNSLTHKRQTLGEDKSSPMLAAAASTAHQ
eukprot:2314766-Prymnesium_polylepis.1